MKIGYDLRLRRKVKKLVYVITNAVNT